MCESIYSCVCDFKCHRNEIQSTKLDVILTISVFLHLYDPGAQATKHSTWITVSEKTIDFNELSKGWCNILSLWVVTAVVAHLGYTVTYKSIIPFFKREIT